MGRAPIRFAVASSRVADDDQGCAVVEWECALKHPEDGAREGARLVRDHIIRLKPHAYDDFASAEADEAASRAMLGLDR